MPFKLQVLHIVVMPSEVQVNFILSEHRLPIANQRLMIPMRPIGKDRVMAHHNGEWSLPRPLQLSLQPRKLFGSLLWLERIVRSAIPLSIRRWHVAVERDYSHQWILHRKLKPVP